MDRNTAVMTWREVCGSDAVMASMPPTGRMLEDFARRIEASERERCAKLCEAEHVGASLTADDLVPCDEAYNMALQHAAASIRGPNVANKRRA